MLIFISNLYLADVTFHYSSRLSRILIPQIRSRIRPSQYKYVKCHGLHYSDYSTLIFRRYYVYTSLLSLTFFFVFLVFFNSSFLILYIILGN